MWILRLIRWWLKAGVLEEDHVSYSDTGTPQGGVISPLLANLYLNELDRGWTERGYNSIRYEAHWYGMPTTWSSYVGGTRSATIASSSKRSNSWG